MVAMATLRITGTPRRNGFELAGAQACGNLMARFAQLKAKAHYENDLVRRYCADPQAKAGCRVKKTHGYLVFLVSRQPSIPCAAPSAADRIH